MVLRTPTSRVILLLCALGMVGNSLFAVYIGISLQQPAQAARTSDGWDALLAATQPQLAAQPAGALPATGQWVLPGGVIAASSDAQGELLTEDNNTTAALSGGGLFIAAQSALDDTLTIRTAPGVQLVPRGAVFAVRVDARETRLYVVRGEVLARGGTPTDATIGGGEYAIFRNATLYDKKSLAEQLPEETQWWRSLQDTHNQRVATCTADVAAMLAGERQRLLPPASPLLRAWLAASQPTPATPADAQAEPIDWASIAALPQSTKDAAAWLMTHCDTTTGSTATSEQLLAALRPLQPMAQARWHLLQLRAVAATAPAALPLQQQLALASLHQLADGTARTGASAAPLGYGGWAWLQEGVIARDINTTPGLNALKGELRRIAPASTQWVYDLPLEAGVRAYKQRHVDEVLAAEAAAAATSTTPEASSDTSADASADAPTATTTDAATTPAANSTEE